MSLVPLEGEELGSNILRCRPAYPSGLKRRAEQEDLGSTPSVSRFRLASLSASANSKPFCRSKRPAPTMVAQLKWSLYTGQNKSWERVMKTIRIALLCLVTAAVAMVGLGSLSIVAPSQAIAGCSTCR